MPVLLVRVGILPAGSEVCKRSPLIDDDEEQRATTGRHPSDQVRQTGTPDSFLLLSSGEFWTPLRAGAYLLASVF